MCLPQDLVRLGYLNVATRDRRWVANTIRSDYAHAQADLSLCWAHMSEGTFSHVAANLILILLLPRNFFILLFICFYGPQFVFF